ncbi:pickpocket protein 28-like [Episyrphus balteatus]|uniref:pickpocket protein 28-like n=1 Tax=Episyrphus balteatus TaxID=286459 RepID=UPI002485F417|nr:pickpocket protein 28-like [Episyrphus balteatus]
MCYHLINNIWYQRQNNPVIVTFNEKLTPVWDIPFPSVTICPETKSHMNIFNYTKVYHKVMALQNITEEEFYLWNGITQTCVTSIFSFDGEATVANSSDLIKAILTAAPTLDDTLASCYWKKYEQYCESIFESIVTNEGICFSFNSLKSEYYRPELYNVRKADFIGTTFDNVEDVNWDLENGYHHKADEDAFPYRVLGAGDMQSLVVTLADRKEDKEQICRNYVQGFKIAIHTPGDDIQLLTSNYINVPLDQSVSITIKPKIINSDDLRHYLPEKRQCYYQNEPYLRYFKVYTQANCELEWLTNATLLECGCVKFSMPRNSSHPVCGSELDYCVDFLTSFSRTLKFGQVKKVKSENVCKGDGECLNYCLPTCISIEYKAEIKHQVAISYSQVAETNVDIYSNFKYNYSNTRISQVKISFNDDHFNGLKRSELYSTTDLIANCGGLLGLFMGVSILSLVELVYFFTLRLWTNLKNNRKIQDDKSKGNALWARPIRHTKMLKAHQSKPNSSIRFRKQKSIKRY